MENKTIDKINEDIFNDNANYLFGNLIDSAYNLGIIVSIPGKH